MNTMKSIQRGALLLAALLLSLMTTGNAGAQNIHPMFRGKFTLPTPVHWGKGVLQPGDYTICIESMGTPTFAIIEKEGSPFMARFVSSARNDYQGKSDALQLKIKNGVLIVQALELGDWKIALVYDTPVRKLNVEEARGETSVSILVAKK